MDQFSHADERSLAASGTACLERCFFESETAEVLRPVWLAVGNGETWLAELRTAVESLLSALDEEAAADARASVGPLPSAYTKEELLDWAAHCSAAALEFHQRVDGVEPADDVVKRYLQGDTKGIPPLTQGELRRQSEILELLAGEAAVTGLRPVLELSTEGKRVLRAAFSRRARVTNRESGAL
ncbi:hypothetical protein [Streptomyces sp. GC420]|uniref:hypothetical protein n=1 Tax=Streptomyces sp. GC420 TaxID=2697568 RepID=UPI0028BDD7BF|nr:hypothetical protein [Streptomyces sp. GC420]